MSELDDLIVMYRNNKEKVIIGTRRTIKYIKNNRVEKVYLANNVPEDVEEDINYYSKLGKFSVIKLNISNEELGALLKKPFKISVISILK